MSIFKEGTKVSVVGDDHIIRTGTIRSVYETLGIAIVIMDDGNVEKVSFNRMGIVPETETQRDQDDNNEPREDVKVISRKYFSEVLLEVNDPEKISSMGYPGNALTVSLTLGLLGFKLVNDIFGDRDVIKISREQLANAIVEFCRPSALSESINDQMPISKIIPIAMMTGIVFSDVVGILFGECENA